MTNAKLDTLNTERNPSLGMRLDKIITNFSRLSNELGEYLDHQVWRCIEFDDTIQEVLGESETFVIIGILHLHRVDSKSNSIVEDSSVISSSQLITC